MYGFRCDEKFCLLSIEAELTTIAILSLVGLQVFPSFPSKRRTLSYLFIQAIVN
jgi:hypothetical protein